MLALLNEKIQKFLDNPLVSKYIENFDELEKKCYEVLNEKFVAVENYGWSRNIDINESIKIIYDFLLTVDKELANQYKNIISAVDENNEPMFIVQDKKTSKYPFNGVLKNGKVKFYYEGNLNDMFSIVHEISHVFNRCIIENEEGIQECTFPREEYTEAVSIILEFLLGEYLVNNNIITQNDFNLRKNFRLENEKTCAMSLIVQIDLIKKFIRNKEIIQDDIDELFMRFYEEKILRKTTETYGYGFNDIIQSIIFGMGLKLETDLKYIEGCLVSKKVLSSDNPIKDFVNLNNIIGNPNCTYEDVNKILR